MRNKVKSALGVDVAEKDSNPAAPTTTEAEEEEDDADEGEMCTYLEMARSIYLEKNLKGSFEISRSFGIWYRTVSCSIDGVAATSEELDRLSIEHATEKPAGQTTQLSTTQKLVKAAMTKLISGLMKRGIKYKSKSYKNDMELTSTIYVSGPAMGLVSISISFTAEVESLIAAHKYELAQKEGK